MARDKKSMKEWGGRHGGTGGLYFVGFIGALVYYIQTAPNFWSGVVDVIKALVWPGVLVYQLFKFLHM
jgi:hypothetical protein